jgi:MFS family permease
MRASTPSDRETKTLGQAITAGTVGNVMEWFDFALYGYMTPYIGPLFFPLDDRVASTIAAFAVFAIGYLARPLGALVLGRVGDRVGRRFMLVLSISIQGASSFAIGLLPTYASIGTAGPVLLVLLRLAQGFSVGGEYTGSMAYASEVSPHGRRGLLSSLATTGTMLGILLSGMAVWMVRSLIGSEALAAWGWRIPFLFGLVVMIFDLAIRTRIPETLLQDGPQAGAPRTYCCISYRSTSYGRAHGNGFRGAGRHDKRDAANRRSLHSFLRRIQPGNGSIRRDSANGGPMDAEEGELASGACFLHDGLVGAGAVVHQPQRGNGVQAPRLRFLLSGKQNSP